MKDAMSSISLSGLEPSKIRTDLVRRPTMWLPCVSRTGAMATFSWAMNRNTVSTLRAQLCFSHRHDSVRFAPPTSSSL